MVKAMKRLEDSPVSERPKRRKSERTPSRAVVYIGHNQGERIEATLCDLSTFGCAIRTKAEWLRIGKFISIQLGDLPSLQALIRWVEGGTAGLEFLRPIPSERTEWHRLLSSHYIF